MKYILILMIFGANGSINIETVTDIGSLSVCRELGASISRRDGWTNQYGKSSRSNFDRSIWWKCVEKSSK